MTIFNWLSLFGIPALLSAGFGYLISQIRTSKTKEKALELGVQALLRDRLLQGYKHYMNQGWVGYADRLNMENIYQNYHNLGSNGIMDEYRKRFLGLPTYEEDKDEKKMG